MEKTIVITGGGSGLGQALAWEFAQLNFQVYIIGRRSIVLTETQSRFPEHIHIIVADVSSQTGRQLISEELKNINHIDYLIHNAGTVEPISPLAEINEQQLQQTLATNCLGPLFLTQLLLPKLKNSRILHTSSLWAHQAASNFGSYCISKAAFYMSKEVLNLELSNSGILFGSASPGIVDTPMQETMRKSEKSGMLKKYFIQSKEQAHIIAPKVSAKFFRYLLLETTAAEFTQGEWYIYDIKHHKHWLGDDVLPQPL